MSRPGPNPFLVPTGELFRHLGTRSRLERAGKLPGVALSSSRLDEDADVEVDLMLEAQGRSVTASGTIRARWVGECRRCLATTGGDLEVDFHEVFEPDPDEGETYPLGRDHLDLTPALREAVALALPLAPLCREECAGPDPEEHPVEVEGEGGDDEGEEGRPADPRWAALDQLRFDR